MDVYNEVKQFLINNPNEYSFEGDGGSISLYSDLLFEAMFEVKKESFLNLSNIVYVALCTNGNYYVGSSFVRLRDRFPNHSIVMGKNFNCFLFLIQCSPKIGAREVEHAIFYNLARATLKPYETFEKSGIEGFKVELPTYEEEDSNQC